MESLDPIHAGQQEVENDQVRWDLVEEIRAAAAMVCISRFLMMCLAFIVLS